MMNLSKFTSNKTILSKDVILDYNQFCNYILFWQKIITMWEACAMFFLVDIDNIL